MLTAGACFDLLQIRETVAAAAAAALCGSVMVTALYLDIRVVPKCKVRS